MASIAETLGQPEIYLSSPEKVPVLQSRMAEIEALLPEKYASADNSGLTVTVEDGNEITDLKFDLQD